MRIREIIKAINVLDHNPLIGCPVSNGKCELVIGRRSHGYVALYRQSLKLILLLAAIGRKFANGNNCEPLTAHSPWLSCVGGFQAAFAEDRPES